MNLNRTEATNLAYHQSHPAEFQAARIKETALTYLSDLPKSLDANSPDIASRVAIALGNFLLWIAPTLEPGAHQIEQPLSETPITVHALGKQFRVVGLKYLDAKKQEKQSAMYQLKADVEKLRDRLLMLETGYVASGAPVREEAA